MRVLHICFALCALNLSTAMASSTSHCLPQEQKLFDCAFGRKVMSICSSPELTAKSGYVQYRFGRIGNPELVYPVERTSPLGHFRYSHKYAGRWQQSHLQFSVAGHTYILFAYGNSAIPESEATMLVVSPEGKRSQLSCGSPSLYIGADLAQLQALSLPPVADEYTNAPTLSNREKEAWSLVIEFAKTNIGAIRDGGSFKYAVPIASYTGTGESLPSRYLVGIHGENKPAYAVIDVSQSSGKATPTLACVNYRSRELHGPLKEMCKQ